MNYLAAIPCVNRSDLLREAIESIKPFWEQLVLIDNTGRSELAAQDFGHPFPIIEPLVPLSFSQTMNAVMHMASKRGCDFYITMHNDAVALEGTPEKLLELVQQLFETKSNWGVVFTNYDTLCAFNTSAVQDVGEWDTVLPQYFSDVDYYRRVKLKGYEIVSQEGLPVLHQNNASNTINSDKALRLRNDRTFRLYERYYISKWGGKPNEEQFTIPFEKETR